MRGPLIGKALVAVVGAFLAAPAVGHADEPAPGFAHSTQIPSASGLHLPSQLEFASDGRVFVGELSGKIKVFDDLTDSTPALFADLREEVHAFSDRGLLGLALDPEFPLEPYVYVLYTRNAVIGGDAPRWEGSDPFDPDLDDCPDPPGLENGCVVSGRLARLEMDPVSGAAIDSDSDGTPDEEVLVDGWCQQFNSHSVGDLEFGADGYLYASGGEGASYNFPDYGQVGSGDYPPNPCGDPPTPAGTASTPKLGEGGSLRAQDLRTGSDPTGVSGALIRVDPETGAAAPTNPLNGSGPDQNAKRILAYGMRNPFRFAIRPGSGEVWIGDVGQTGFEEINRVPAAPAQPRNFGWPCYEGPARLSTWDAIDNDICENLYAGVGGSATSPYFEYLHQDGINAAGDCPSGGSSAISGMAFAPPGHAFPSSYDGALFFADYTRSCIAVMPLGLDGKLDRDGVQPLVTDAGYPVDLEFGPDGALYWADIYRRTVEKVEAVTGNVAPVARITTSEPSGPTPLTIEFDGSTSSDANGDDLTYHWDLDGDGEYDDSTAAAPTWVYDAPGIVEVGLEVRDSDDPITFERDTASVAVFPGNTPPALTISNPGPGFEFVANEPVQVEGSAIDAEDGELPGEELKWDLRIAHCPQGGGCHEHPFLAHTGPSWEFTAPDHEYPSHLELTLEATDSWGLAASKTVSIDPSAIDILLRSRPRGMKLSIAGRTERAPFRITVIEGSGNLLAAVSPQRRRNRRFVKRFKFRRWSDGGERVHAIEATPQAPDSLRAVYKLKRKRRR